MRMPNWPYLGFEWPALFRFRPHVSFFLLIFSYLPTVLLLTLTLIVHAYYDSGTCVGFNRENRSRNRWYISFDSCANTSRAEVTFEYSDDYILIYVSRYWKSFLMNDSGEVLTSKCQDDSSRENLGYAKGKKVNT